MRLLLVEDDRDLGMDLQQALRAEQHQCDWVRTLADANRFRVAGDYDALLLDVGLPDGTGLDLLRQLRSRQDLTPVVLLTARGAIDDRVAGLDEGADDYVVKPFAVPELLSRLRVVTRRGHQGSATWQEGRLRVETTHRRMYWDGMEVSLSRREYDILLALARQPGVVLTRQQLARTLADGEPVESNAVDVHVCTLRKKLDAAAIVTWRGVGYQLRTNAVAGRRP